MDKAQLTTIQKLIGELLDFVVRADGDDPIAVNRDCLRRRMVAVHRMHVSIYDDQVGGKRWIVGVRGEVD